MVTKNSKERVQMGSYRFIFAFATSLLIQSVTVGFVAFCGGGASAWRTVAIIYAIIGLIVNTISGCSVKELSEEELGEGKADDEEKKYGLVEAFGLLIKNKFYMMICGTYLLQQLYNAMIGTGIYYMTWVLKNKNLYSVFAWAVNIPLIIALIFTPALVEKWNGMYKLNKRSYMLATVGRGPCCSCRFRGKCTAYDSFHGHCSFGTGTMAGGYECGYCILLRIYLSDSGKTRRRNYVFLHILWAESRWRYWYCYNGLAFGSQRLCRNCQYPACISNHYDDSYVSCYSICY